MRPPTLLEMIFKNLKCLFGLHDWTYGFNWQEEDGNKCEFCWNCGKRKN